MSAREKFKKRDARIACEDREYLNERGFITICVLMFIMFLTQVELNQLGDFMYQAGWAPGPVSFSAPQTPAQ
jgi:hypothetical protein